MKEKKPMLKRTMLALLLTAVCWIPASAEVLPGDVNCDGMRGISDVTALIDYLLTKDASSIDLETADVDGDGNVCIVDVTVLTDMILMAKDHEWVDLGLPSGTLWATCNVGATTPEEYGDYFAWGETEPKDYYDWDTYKWSISGNTISITKYCKDSNHGYNGFVDNKTELDPEDDAAYVNWGPSWRMPTMEQQQELIDNCTCTWTTQNGVNGCLVTGPNNASLFLPAAGMYFESSLDLADSRSVYWARTLGTKGSINAYNMSFTWRGPICNFFGRLYGLPVRPVRVPQD